MVQKPKHDIGIVYPPSAELLSTYLPQPLKNPYQLTASTKVILQYKVMIQSVNGFKTTELPMLWSHGKAESAYRIKDSSVI